MAVVTWGSQFETGIEEIDGQHKRLVKLLNDLHDGMIKGKTKAALRETLEGLIDYTKDHFATEESLLEQYRYPGLERQREQHAQLLQDVGEMRREFEDGASNVADKLLEFLKNWLVRHILHSDKLYGPFLQDKMK